jgi:hypothetical protein
LVPEKPNNSLPLEQPKFGVVRKIFMLISWAALVSCGEPSSLSPFTSDGCSLFPDRSPISTDDWCSCCLEHDVAYWRGGTENQREAADMELRRCIEARTGDAALATLMYRGVRAGGSPYFVNGYRWGYGWGIERTYQALTPEEESVADELLANYHASGKEAVCGSPAESSAWPLAGPGFRRMASMSAFTAISPVRH